MKNIYDVPIILRREIEALMVKPFLDAFEKELGHDKTYEILKLQTTQFVSISVVCKSDMYFIRNNFSENNN